MEIKQKEIKEGFKKMNSLSLNEEDRINNEFRLKSKSLFKLSRIAASMNRESFKIFDKDGNKFKNWDRRGQVILLSRSRWKQV